jgi:hypothetical protein
MNDLTVYNQVKTGMKTGDALLYKSKGSLIGWAIQQFSEFNHAGVVVRFGEDACGVDRVWTLEAIGRGVKPAYLSTKLRKYRGEVWWYPLRDEFDDRRALMMECALILKDTDYDFKSLFKNALGYVSTDLSNLFCSEYWFAIMQYAGVLPDGLAPRPGDIPKFMIFKNQVRLV